MQEMITKTPDKIVVTITPRDVLTTPDWLNITDCAMCKAIRRKLRLTMDDYVSADHSEVTIIEDFYSIVEEFDNVEFDDLKKRAESGERFKVKKTLTRVLSSLNSEIK